MNVILLLNCLMLRDTIQAQRITVRRLNIPMHCFRNTAIFTEITCAEALKRCQAKIYSQKPKILTVCTLHRFTILTVTIILVLYQVTAGRLPG